jgi:uncharacterized protein YbjT (DUF2867 family)
VILVCGATGDLGGRIVRRLLDDDHPVRALVRPSTDPGDLEESGAEVAVGDLRDPDSLTSALDGVDTVVTTANAIGRLLAGPTDLTIADVDRQGNENLVRAAEAADVQRFVYLSAAGVERMARSTPYHAAKLATEHLLDRTPMQVVLVRPGMYQEVWAGAAGGIDAASGRAAILGRGKTPHRFVAVDDFAALTAHLAVAPRSPRVVEFGGPEALTMREVVDAYESETGRSFKVRRVPRPLLPVLRRVLRPVRPGLASVMGMAWYYDRHGSTWDDTAIRAIGIDPRPVSAYIREQAAAGRRAH